jgi:superfamily II DNA or RNA helicase
MKLRDYQIENANLLHQNLSKFRLVYFMAEVRTGKTLTSLEVAKLYGSKKVLFITKKKAISSILDDYNDFEYHQHFDILAINYESLHKIDYKPDLVIIDEAHNIGAFPKPNKRQKELKEICNNLPIIYLSGTPAVESSSQWYHQFWVSSFSPFAQYKTFYKWAKDYVNVKQRHLGYGVVNDYSDGITKKIENDIRNVIIRFSQQNAGFQSKVEKHIIDVDNDKQIIHIQKILQKNKFVQGKEDCITADTMAKEKIKEDRALRLIFQLLVH